MGIAKHLLLDRRLLLSLAAILAMAALVCGGIVWSGMRLDRLALEDEHRQASKEAELTREAFEIHTLDLVNYVDAHLMGLRAAYLRRQSLEDARHYVEQVPFDRAVIDDLALVSADGELVLWSGAPSFKAVDLSDRDYFVAQRQSRDDQLYFSAVQFGRVSGKYLFRMSRRLVDENGVFVGIVLASVDPYSISRFYQDMRIGRQSTTSLLATDLRRLLARYPQPAATHWEQTAESPIWASLAQASQGSYAMKSRIDGVQRTYFYKKLDKYPLAVVVGFSPEDVAERIRPRQERQHFSENILILAVLGITLLLIVITFHRRSLAIANRDLQGLYEQVRGLALFDALTGLPNRSLLDDRLAQALLDAERNQEACALIYLDLDDFKEVNDSLGHDAGDHVLAVTASRMSAAVRATDTVSRRGGDEFVILLPHAGTLPEILEIADRLVQWVAEPILYQGQPCGVSASVGIAIYPANGPSIETMLKAADEAMYAAKRQGKNKIVLAEANATPAEEKTED